MARVYKKNKDDEGVIRTEKINKKSGDNELLQCRSDLRGGPTNKGLGRLNNCTYLLSLNPIFTGFVT